MYVLFGGLATIVDWSVFALGIYSFGMHYALAVTISFSFGSITNFTLNKYLNFQNKYKKVHLQFLLYLVIALIGLALTILFMWLMIDGMAIGEFTARVITTAIVLIYNFLGHKFVTFRLLR
jgi:putative flippase GtrA